MTRTISELKMQTSVSLLLGTAVIRERGPETAAQIRHQHGSTATNSARIDDGGKLLCARTKAARDAHAIRTTLLADSEYAWRARLGRVSCTLDQLWVAVQECDDRLSAMILLSGVDLPPPGTQSRKQMLHAIVGNDSMCRTANTLIELDLFEPNTDFNLELLVACSNTPHTAIVRRICEHAPIQAALDAAPNATTLHRDLSLRYAYWRASNFVNFDADLTHLAQVLQHVDISRLEDDEVARVLFDGDRLREMPQRSAVALVRQLEVEISGQADEVNNTVSSLYKFARDFADLVELFSPRYADLDTQACRAFYDLLYARLNNDELNLSPPQIESIVMRLRLPLEQPPMHGINSTANSQATACA